MDANARLSDEGHSAGNGSSRLNAREYSLAQLFKHVRYGRLAITFPSGRQRIFGDEDCEHIQGMAELHIHSWKFLSRLLRNGTIGFAEGYMEGEWSSRNLSALLLLLAKNLDAFEQKISLNRLSRLFDKVRHIFNANSRRGSKRNIAYHYDLGNDFYQLWLDESMTYSSALFEENNQLLSEAQTAKYRALAKEVGIKPGDRVLEIGCGWGGFAEFAVREMDCHVTGLTLSKEQLAFAQERLYLCQKSDRAEFLLRDYRDMSGKFDHIVSIEMLEAVGEVYWPQYFAKVRELLKKGGRAGIQVITIQDKYFANYRKSVDFIQKYIFPGGMLLTDSIMKNSFSNNGLKLIGQRDMGKSYARTLALWQQRFMAQYDKVRDMGFDDKFMRMWQLYLGYCEAGFDVGRIDVSQYVAEG